MINVFKIINKHVSIVPEKNFYIFILKLIFAIMTFFVIFIISGLNFIYFSEKRSINNISRGAIIQISPEEGEDIEKTLHKIVSIVKSFKEIGDVSVVNRYETENLIKPWIKNINISDLQIPRLIVVFLKKNYPPDFNFLKNFLKKKFLERI